MCVKSERTTSMCLGALSEVNPEMRRCPPGQISVCAAQRGQRCRNCYRCAPG
jgi:hypothetical protein